MSAETMQAVYVDDIYVNTKTGNFYKLLLMAKDTDTEELRCLYQRVNKRNYEEDGFTEPFGDVWDRKLTEFAGRRENGDWYFECVEMKGTSS